MRSTDVPMLGESFEHPLKRALGGFIGMESYLSYILGLMSALLNVYYNIYLLDASKMYQLLCGVPDSPANLLIC